MAETSVQPVTLGAQALGARVSVIIPTKNEAENLQVLLPQLQALAPEAEVLVIDGESGDDSMAIARSLGARTACVPGGRAQQMNRGAELATGEILLFLHADTRLPQAFEAIARKTLAQPEIIAGAFGLRIEGKGWGLRWVEWGVQWRSRLFQMPYGDQAIFVPKAGFMAIGGFADLPIMEDFELVRRLQQRGKIAIAPANVTTSVRRWRRIGVLRTTLVNQTMIAGFLVGVPGERLARWYRDR